MNLLKYAFFSPGAAHVLVLALGAAAAVCADVVPAGQPAPAQATVKTSERPVVDPKLREGLKLTDQQWTQFEAVMKEKQTRSKAEFDRHMAAQRVINAQTETKLAGILDEEQMAAYYNFSRKSDAAEAERLEAVAAEVRKRREMRQRALNGSPEEK